MNQVHPFPDFAEFFRAVTAGPDDPGFDPLPWQTAAADRYINDGRLPDAINVPTGLGKTAVMLVHLYALARDVHQHGPEGRTVPLRCFHVVERRVVVDAAAETAERAAAVINSADEGDVVFPVRDALVRLIPTPMRQFEPVVATASLHGGRPRRGTDRNAWLRPVGALLVTATVTQVVSRVLFRGVGVSRGVAPMHAAVTGMDRLMLVDEPHLSVPGVTALRESEAVQDAAPVSLGIPAGQTVTLGATVPDELMAGKERLSIGVADRVHPIASRRLNAPRTLRLHTVTDATDAAAHAYVEKAMAREAAEAYQADLARASEEPAGDAGVLVFCNTVAAARRIAELLRKSKTPVRLVHGRFREGDRWQVQIDRTAVTVATQTLEVGADLDGVHVLTQCPSLAALVQRAGRCNRRGRLTSAFVDVYAAGVVDPGTTAVYGEYADRLLTVLAQLVPPRGRDISATGLETLIPALEKTANGTLSPDEPRTALLSPQVARYAAYTSAGYSFPSEAFLYGPDTPRDDDVRVAWRSEGLDLLTDIPVMSEETVSVPLEILRDILRRADGTRIPERNDGDTVATAATKENDKEDQKRWRVSQDVLQRVRIKTTDNSWTVPENLQTIAPGATVVLATDLGGYTVEAGLKPASTAAVPDISEQVARHRGDGRWLLPTGELTDTLALSLHDDITGTEARRLAATELDLPEVDVVLLGDDTRVGIVDRTSAPPQADSGNGRIVTLDDHSHQVGVWTAATAAVLPLPPEIAERLTAAGHAHDTGKADRRFQLRLGNRRFAGGGTAWAKSRRLYTAAYEARLREQSGLPIGWRHEVLSADGVGDHLIRHLVLAHHGGGRPLIFHEQQVRTEHVGVFDSLTDTYGPWALALMETVMRWADHRASQYPAAFPSHAAPVPVTRSEDLTITQSLARFDADAAGWEVTALPGASSSPLAGTLGAVGLLATLRAREGGYLEVLLRWNPDTGVPEIASRTPLPDLAQIVRSIEPWRSIDDHIRTALGVPKGVGVKYAKAVPTFEVSKRAVLAHPGYSLLIHDTSSDSDSTWKLWSFLHANNSSGAFAAAFISATGEAFLDPTVGFAVADTVKSSGVDTTADRYGKDLVRADMLAWALDGYLALGWSPTVRGTHATSNTRLDIARPTFWVTPEQFRALTLSARGTALVAHGTWHRAQVSKGVYVWHLASEGTDANGVRTE